MKRAMIIWALSVTCWFLTASAQLHADIYTWTDERGVRHYSNRPPSEAKDPRVLFKEYQHDSSADQQRFDMEEREWKVLMELIESEERQRADEARRRTEESLKNRKPTLSQRAASEQKRLEELIVELEKKPLEYFGSYQNKRTRLGYYRNRLETLMRDPEGYFKNPEAFRGSIKTPEEGSP